MTHTRTDPPGHPQQPNEDPNSESLASRLAPALSRWLPHQRWFAGKGRPVDRVYVVASETVMDQLDGGGTRAEHLIVRVVFADGAPSEQYQVPVGLRAELPERLEHMRIGEISTETDSDTAVDSPTDTVEAVAPVDAVEAVAPVDAVEAVEADAEGSGSTDDVDDDAKDGDELVAYDALWDLDITSVVLKLIAVGGERGDLRFVPEPGATVQTGLPSRVMDAEQSNTSVVYGEEYILKLFRRVSAGLNPDVELHRALRGVGCRHIAEPFGAIEGSIDDGPATFGLLQQFASNSAEGWAMATASVRDLLAEGDLRADEVGGDFAAESFRLGAAVAAVHRDLARAMGASERGVDGLDELATAMLERLDDALRVVPALSEHADDLREAFNAVRSVAPPLTVQRVHGDLHLGQVLRTPRVWLLIDFEGEPAKPLSERASADSPLRDVAGMLRSFDYAAHHLLLDAESPAQQMYRSHEWSDRNRTAFCDGYTHRYGSDPREQSVLLHAYELDKAVYETVYEARNRPAWQAIPLRSVARLLGHDEASAPAQRYDLWD